MWQHACIAQTEPEAEVDKKGKKKKMKKVRMGKRLQYKKFLASKNVAGHGAKLDGESTEDAFAKILGKKLHEEKEVDKGYKGRKIVADKDAGKRKTSGWLAKALAAKGKGEIVRTGDNEEESERPAKRMRTRSMDEAESGEGSARDDGEESPKKKKSKKDKKKVKKSDSSDDEKASKKAKKDKKQGKKEKKEKKEKKNKKSTTA
jgi:hypothetical protein